MKNARAHPICLRDQALSSLPFLFGIETILSIFVLFFPVHCLLCRWKVSMFLLLLPSQRSLTVSVGTLVMVRTFALFSWFPFYLPVALERRTDVSHCCFRIFGRFVQLSGWSLLISTINIDFFINICDFYSIDQWGIHSPPSGHQSKNMAENVAMLHG